MKISFYHRETGAIHQQLLTTDDPTQVAGNTPADHIAIDGHHDPLSKRVEVSSGQVLEYQPPQPSVDHEWNDETKRWNLNGAAQGRLDRHHFAVRRIAQLEQKSMRAMREIQLSVDGGTQHLQAIHAEIERCRLDLIPEVGDIA